MDIPYNTFVYNKGFFEINENTECKLTQGFEKIKLAFNIQNPRGILDISGCQNHIFRFFAREGVIESM